ncbi:hypothetical protein [Prosthecobacter sp.]|jgi:hypothetical protein|uniref:hypothetical protein n=1 Tax=Prosthecobacter sp. TaxID=1965333 RepID=UPI0037CC3B52
MLISKVMKIAMPGSNSADVPTVATQKYLHSGRPALLDEIRNAPLSPKSILSQSIPSSSDSCVPLPGARLDGIKSLGSNYILRGPNTRGEAEPVAPKFASLEDLNWIDWDEVLENKRLLNQGHRILLGIAEKKKDFFPEGFECGNYFDNLLPIICGGYAKADKIVYCGNNNLKGYKVPCDQWTLCSKCAYVEGIDPSEAFDGTFGKDNFYHVTLGFDDDIPFDITTSGDPKIYWKANETALRHLLNNDLIRGAYISHELKIRSLVPLQVNPHSHAIVTASAFPPELNDALGEMISEVASVGLIPSIEVKLIDSKEYHKKCIRYLTKAIELKEPYETAWQKLCALDRSHAKEVNLAMRNFLDAFGAAGSGINKRVYMGNLMSQSKSFIGVPAKGRPSVIKREEYKASKAKGKRGKRKKVKATRR